MTLNNRLNAVRSNPAINSFDFDYFTWALKNVDRSSFCLVKNFGSIRQNCVLPSSKYSKKQNRYLERLDILKLVRPPSWMKHGPRSSSQWQLSLARASLLSRLTMRLFSMQHGQIIMIRWAASGETGYTDQSSPLLLQVAMQVTLTSSKLKRKLLMP